MKEELILKQKNKQNISNEEKHKILITKKKSQVSE